MQVYQSISDFQQGKHTVATIGTYDGVHLGHVEILNELTALATESQGDSVVITLHPHPRLVLSGGMDHVQLLTTLDEKLNRLEVAGIDKVLVLPFTKEFALISAEEYIKTILVDTLKVRNLFIGYDHRFGANRSGNMQTLIKASRKHGFSVNEIQAYAIDQINVSSTHIRNALLASNISKANTYLGYNYKLTATVVEGNKLGRTIGFPTANLRINNASKLIPGLGVYTVQVEIGNATYGGMMNIGKRPTLDAGYALEVHIFDFEKNIYGETLTVEFIKKIRRETKFVSVDALRDQLVEDKYVALGILKNESKVSG